MQKLTDVGQTIVNNLAQRYGLSQDAVVHMLVAVNNGNGSMAQFNCPELGGGGQWMRGGMTMVGDMFNTMAVRAVKISDTEALVVMTMHPALMVGDRIKYSQSDEVVLLWSCLLEVR